MATKSTKSKLFSYAVIDLNGSDFKKRTYNSKLNTMFQVASCSKFITALCVARLYDRGKLDYDTDINRYLKKWKCPKDITLRMLLTHTSGSTDRNGYLGLPPLTELKQTNELNIKFINGKGYAKGINFENEPGKFYYSGAGYQVVQQVLEELTGKPLYKLMEELIFKPLVMLNSTGKLLYPGKHKYPLADMKNTYRIHAETAAAGVWMSAEDLLILSIDLLKTYHDDAGTLLKRETLLNMLAKPVDCGYAGLKQGLGCHITNYGTKKEAFGHNGLNYGYSMKLNIYPKINRIFIQLVNYNPALISDEDSFKLEL